MLGDLLHALALALSDLSGAQSLFILVALAGGALALGMLALPKVRARLRVLRRIDTGVASPAQMPPTVDRVRRQFGGLMTLLADGLGETGSDQAKVLRMRLVQAGYFDGSAVALFFGMRFLALVVMGAAAFLMASLVMPEATAPILSLAALMGSVIGYLTPSMALGRRIDRFRLEHRSGFPDFMDLMVVCSQAGLSMEAGLARIAAEIALAFPSLSRHLLFATREIRSGKPVSRAIESLAHRLGIEEAVTFATLLQQSEELGSSITQSLRAYSDDMRNKRLMKAEEKAYALPAKLVIPLTVFIFPVLLIVLILPVAISVSSMNS
jgi:tight adherence protein C